MFSTGISAVYLLESIATYRKTQLIKGPLTRREAYGREPLKVGGVK